MNKYLGIAKPYFYFLLIWLLFNLLQAAYTFLHFDEAYYWMYSRKLAWGYFDHPPIVAVLCYLGYTLFENEFGLRLLHVLFSTGTMYFIIRLVQGKLNVKRTIIVILSFPLVFLHISGFLALPDTPLLFFAVAFLFVYRQFLEKSTLKRAILLGIFGALMVLSKYHGGILLVFIFLSNWRLLLNKFAWIAVFILLLIITPHIYWQFSNNFPSFSYHLSQRVSGFSIESVLHYVGSQFVIVGLLTGTLVIYSVVVFKAKNAFEKTLQFISVGFWLFFLLMSFRDNMEAHWTAVVMPAMMYIVVDTCKEKKKFALWFQRLAIPGICLLILARIFLIGAIPSFGIKKVMWGWDKESKAISEHAHGLPVLIGSSYKMASLYSFYSKTISPAIPEYFERYTQYDLLHFEDRLIGEKVFVLTPKIKTDTNFVLPNGKTVSYFIADNYISYRNLEISNCSISISDSIYIKGIITNNAAHDLNYSISERLKPCFVLQCLDNGVKDLHKIPFDRIFEKNSIAPKEQQPFSLSYPALACSTLRLQIRSYTFRGDEVVFP